MYAFVRQMVVCGQFVFFFFQAEDGIRDTSVTGVQTCALPICVVLRDGALVVGGVAGGEHGAGDGAERSEERRVGKECRSRGLTYNKKKKSKMYMVYMDKNKSRQ